MSELKKIQEKCEQFLEESGLNDLVLTLTLECVHCNVLAVCKEPPFFKCPKCDFIWEIQEIPRGFNKK